MPVRTCAVCRQRAEQKELLRFVLQVKREGESDIQEQQFAELILDVEGRTPGRGTYCHSMPGCLYAKNAEKVLVGALRRGRKQEEKKIFSFRPRTINEILSEGLSLLQRKGRGLVWEDELLKVLRKLTSADVKEHQRKIRL